VFQDAATGVITLPVSLGGHNLGALTVSGAGVSEAAAHAFANLMAIALEREQAHELAHRAEAARQNEQLKSILLDAVAHEFKTPLTSIKAAATALLTDEGSDSDQRELLTVVDEETDRLTQLVDEAIQMARIEAGQLKLERHAISIADLVGSVLREMKAPQRERSIQTEMDSVPPVNADPEQIQLVLRQILDNALKYSPAGSVILLRVRLQGGDAVISVADQGPGIAEHDLAHLFERFYRGKGTRDRIPGTGMGLAIAREIVVAHGGRIYACNLPTRGAEFSFTLPLAEEALTS
jgi:two-component system, OmpR family, sensor histidine kinase KdpD